VLDRGNEGFLESVLSELEIAEDSNQRGQNPAVRLTKDQLDRCLGRLSGSRWGWLNYCFQLLADCCQRGRISIEPVWA
jgi:hypothetical protein